MKLLVTGGCGFIGSNFIKFVLRNTDYEIKNVDKLTYAARPRSLEEIILNSKYSKRYEFFKADICNIEIMKELMNDVDFVINFAAETHVDRSIGQWESDKELRERWKQTEQNAFIDTNMLGTQALLELTRKNIYTVRGMLEAAKFSKIKKFIQISTDECYGPVNRPAKEKQQLNPRNPYAATKAASECLANAYFYTFNVPVCITRSCNNYGPWQGSEKFIPVVILSALADSPVPIYGSGKNIRDWIFVDDNAAAILAVLEKGKIGEAYNIPGENEKTNIQVAEAILQIMNKPRELITFVKDRPGHDFRYSMCGEKIRKECGWRPNFSFEKGLEITIDFYKEYEKEFREDQRKSGVLERIKGLLEK